MPTDQPTDIGDYLEVPAEQRLDVDDYVEAEVNADALDHDFTHVPDGDDVDLTTMPEQDGPDQ